MVRAPNEVETGRSEVPKPLGDPLLKEDRLGEHLRGLEKPQRELYQNRKERLPCV